MQRAVLSFLLVLSLTACRGGNENAATDTLAGTTDTATATHPASPGGTAIVPSVSGGTTVLVTLADGRVLVQDADRVPPGPAIVTVTNNGPGVHNLFIEGEGLNRATEGTLSAGGTSSIDAVFKPGSYTLYCPVLNHREAGESVTLVIKPANAPPPTSTVGPDSPTATSTTQT